MSGEKLPYVQLAAQHLLDLLGEQDRVSVVAYDDEITVVAPSTPVSAETRRWMKERIQAIHTGGSTNLSEGWLTGCGQVAAQHADGQLERALLLTDGQANVGIQEPEELAVHARELCNRGISTSTFGVGEGVNEHLLEAMSTVGGGSYYYIGSPQEIPAIFQSEFSELASAAARDVEITLEVPAGVAAQVLGAWRGETASGRLRIFLGALPAGRAQSVYVNLLFPPAGKQAELVLKGRVLGRGEGDLLLEDSAAVSFVYAESAEVQSASSDQGLLERAAQVRVAEAANQSLKQEREGNREQAYRGLIQSIEACEPYLKSDEIERYQGMARRMRRGMDETDRKSTQYNEYHNRRSHPEKNS
jgi:Ca-activated chloride channel family protein